MSKLDELVRQMRVLGVTRLRMEGDNIAEIELAHESGGGDRIPPSDATNDTDPNYFDVTLAQAEGKCIRCGKVAQDGLVPGHCRPCGKMTASGN